MCFLAPSRPTLFLPACCPQGSPVHLGVWLASCAFLMASTHLLLQLSRAVQPKTSWVECVLLHRKGGGRGGGGRAVGPKAE